MCRSFWRIQDTRTTITCCSSSQPGQFCFRRDWGLNQQTLQYWHKVYARKWPPEVWPTHHWHEYLNKVSFVKVALNNSVFKQFLFNENKPLDKLLIERIGGPPNGKAQHTSHHISSSKTEKLVIKKPGKGYPRSMVNAIAWNEIQVQHNWLNLDILSFLVSKSWNGKQLSSVGSIGLQDFSNRLVLQNCTAPAIAIYKVNS